MNECDNCHNEMLLYTHIPVVVATAQGSQYAWVNSDTGAATTGGVVLRRLRAALQLPTEHCRSDSCRLMKIIGKSLLALHMAASSICRISTFDMTIGEK